MKNKKTYIITTIIILIMFLILFISKGIFPFGNNSLIWGDMHDQITAFYYNIYDTFRGNSSLLVDFSSSGGINFFGILAYYVLSPLSLIVLFFDREKIYLAISIIIILKMLLSALTCLYMIRHLFKKIPDHYSVLLAILYGFNAYNIIMYQITPWIDVVYLFPLVLVGLKKVLDSKKPYLYIITLTLSMIVCFYISYMSLIFIFFISLIYLIVYKTKEERKKGILNLGIATVIPMLLSAFVVIPAYKQISESSRLSIDINKILNSGTGPLTDKLVFYIMASFLIALILLLIKDYKKHKKFLLFYLPSLFLLLIPVIIEPVDKMLHFGTYAFFPYRFGFIGQLLLIIGASYYLNQKQDKEKEIVNTKTKLISIFVTLIPIAINILITKTYYTLIQKNIYTLTISNNKKIIIYFIIMFMVNLIAILIIWLLNKNKKLFTCVLITLITITNIMCMSFLYIGIDFAQNTLTSQYEDMNKLEETYKEGDYFRVKNLDSNLIMNSSLVTKYHNLDHFTSLTNATNMYSLKKLGYSSVWVKTFSRGGTLFLDALLANKYVIDNEEYNNSYYKYINTYGDIKLYELKTDLSYGYFINDNDTIFDKENSFEIQNSLYKSITNTDTNLFTYNSNFSLNNIKIIKEKEYTKYKIIDSYSYSTLEQTVKVEGNKRVYLEILKSIKNNINIDIYNKFNIYINDKLFEKNYPSEISNGVIDLGTYNNETLNIKIEFDNDVELGNITLGIMDLDLYESFVKDEKINTNINYNRNNINIKVDSEETKTLFLPIACSDSYKLEVNGKRKEIVKLYENFIGIKVEKGTNNITLTYTPESLNIGILISIISLILVIILFKVGNIYEKILNNKLVENIISKIYVLGYIGALLLIYIIPIICFILSYFIVIKI